MSDQSADVSRGGRQVYVVSSVNHGEQEGVVAVFDTHELAAHFAAHARTGGSRYHVTTWRLNVTDWTPPEWRA